MNMKTETKTIRRTFQFRLNYGDGVWKNGGTFYGLHAEALEIARQYRALGVQVKIEH